MTQVFGYTPPSVEPGEQYVRFIAIYNDGDTWEFQVRNGDAVINSVKVPASAIVGSFLASPDKPDPAPREAECAKCGGPMSKNPHPKAGEPSSLVEVGAVWQCIPCTVQTRHTWAERARAAEAKLDALPTQAEVGLEWPRGAQIRNVTSQTAPFHSVELVFETGKECLEAFMALNDLKFGSPKDEGQ